MDRLLTLLMSLSCDGCVKQNGNTGIQINVAGMGIGDGWMSPYHNARYANFLYQAGLLDENQRDDCLTMETETQRLIDEKDL